MNQRIYIANQFLKFFLSAKTKYKIHSPFVYQLVENAIDDDRHYYAFEEIEYLRGLLEKDDRKIKITDLGAGSMVNNQKEKSIAKIAKSALSSPWQCQVLFKLVNLLQPNTILELGTSLGISALYQNAASQKAKMISIEGDPTLAHMATHHAESMGRKNLDIRAGAFQQHLAKALNDLGQLDYAFIDGHHEEKATVQYFKECLAHCHENSVVVFDDIHWSAGMTNAWRTIQQHEKVTLSIDCFYFGMVFFRKEQKVKEHFKVMPARWKPWQVGFFN